MRFSQILYILLLFSMPYSAYRIYFLFNILYCTLYALYSIFVFYFAFYSISCLACFIQFTILYLALCALYSILVLLMLYMPNFAYRILFCSAHALYRILHTLLLFSMLYSAYRTIFRFLCFLLCVSCRSAPEYLAAGVHAPACHGLPIHAQARRGSIKEFASGMPPLRVFNAFTGQQGYPVWLVCAWVMNDIRGFPGPACGHAPPCYIGSCNMFHVANGTRQRGQRAGELR